jgi:uncharacterized repeat protein (TIGR03803 family)
MVVAAVGIALGTVHATPARAQININVLHSFSTNDFSANGSFPEGQPLLIGSTLYGVTEYGGSTNCDAGCGTVYQVGTNGTGFSLLCTFTGGADGANPYCTLVSAGSFSYGMTFNGGLDDGGVIFGVATTATNGTNVVLHTFQGGASDGQFPNGSLTLFNGSTLYGMTSGGGSNELGVIFQIGANTNGTNFSVLYSFAGGTNDGAFPNEGVVVGGSTLLYGTTSEGGSNDLGIVFACNTALTNNALTILHHFGGADNDDGDSPTGPLALDGSTLYGVTTYGGADDMGTVFKVGIDGTGYTLLHSFSGWPIDGAWPLFGPLVVTNSVIYGTTQFGGQNDAGVLFEMGTDGTGFTVLHGFTAGSTNDGAFPGFGPLLSGSVLYGVTPNGGTDDLGVVYEALLTNVLPLAACTNVSGSAASGVVTINVTAGEVYQCQSTGSIEFTPNGCWSDPNGHFVGSCAAYTTNSPPCPGLPPFSLVGEVGGICIPLGSSAYFIAPTNGPLTLYYNNDTNYSGSFQTCITPLGYATEAPLTLRVVCYNIQADTVNIANPGIVSPTCGLIMPYTGPGGTYGTNCTGSVTNGGVLEGIGEEIINGDPAQPIDILALEETTSNSQTVQPIVSALNTFYSWYNYLYTTPAGYAMSTYQATEAGGDPTTGNGPNALVYNTNTLQLIASFPVDPPGGTNSLGTATGELREVMRYEFAPAGVTPTTNNEFYVYVSHYKADAGSQYDQERLGEATIIRNDEYLSLPTNSRVLYVGDYNPDDNSGEPGYQTICSNGVPGIANSATGQGQGVDPLNIAWNPYTSASSTINWSSSTTNKQILFMLSEEGYDLLYRDDLQVMTSNVYYYVAGGLQYVHGTYHSFGNNASLPYNTSVNNTNNTALNDLDPVKTNATGLSAAVLLEDLTGASDHLPIVADYTISVSLFQVTPPTCCFTYTTNEPLEICVSDCSVSSLPEIGWEWLWGDGGYSYGSNPPCYTYASAGTYVVTQIVCSTLACCTNSQSVTFGSPFPWWQDYYFGSTTNPAAAPGVVHYGTAMSNTNKFLAGFSGTNAAAYLHIISIANTNGNINVTYLGASGDTNYPGGPSLRTNVLEYTTGAANGSYTNGSWTDTGQFNILGVDQTADNSGGTGKGTVTNMTDFGGSSARPSRFYRVRVLLP